MKTGWERNRLQATIIAYQVSWSPDIVYADAAIERNDENVNLFGRYDFSFSSAMEYGNAYTMAANGVFRCPIEENIR